MGATNRNGSFSKMGNAFDAARATSGPVLTAICSTMFRECDFRVGVFRLKVAWAHSCLRQPLKKLNPAHPTEVSGLSRKLIYGANDSLSEKEQHRLAAKVSRFFRLLRAHGLIKKVQKTHRYQGTARGHLLTAALRATRDANIKQLLKAA